MTQYAYILTVQRPGLHGGGFILTDMTGTCELSAGASRLAVYEQLMQQAADHFQVPRNAVNTIFFSLERDALS